MPPKKPSESKVNGKAVTTTAKKQTSQKPTAGRKDKPGASQEKGKKTTSVKSSSDKSKLLVPKWTREDQMAQKIQAVVRGFLARKELQRRRKEREEYEATMDRLEKEAFARMVRIYQEQAEQARKKEDEERKQKLEMAKRRKRMLEAAFDGNNVEILAVLKEIKTIDDKNGVGHDLIGRVIRSRHQMAMVKCEDSNGNTPLSEAASGGHSDTIRLLIERGADPNTRGHFRRTPLYRAAFAGHLEAVQTLLEYGADPRLYAEDGQTPEQIAPSGALQTVLHDWDIAQTDRMLQQLETEKNQRQEEERQRRDAEASKLEDQISAADIDYRSMQKRLCKATGELNKRITEHDQAILAGFEKTEITLATIHDAETDLEVVKMEVEKARDRLARLKLALRDKQHEGQDAEVGSEDAETGLKVFVRELDDVLMRDVGNRIRDSNRWPLIIDIHEQASTFLRYRDTNYINALSSQQMEPQRIRLAVLGSLRYGKPLVLDMMEVDMFDACTTRFDEVQKGLMDAIMDKTILQESVYLKLVQSTDGEEYRKNQFSDSRTQNFRFFILTKSPFPPAPLVERTYPIRVCIPSSA